MSKYELKTLSAKQVFPMVNLIKKFGVSEFKQVVHDLDIKKLFDKNGEMNGQNLSALGFGIIFDVIAIVIENLEKCEQDIFDFLSSVSNLDAKEIGEMPLDEFAQMLEDVLRKKELKGFFGVVFKLLK